MWITIILGDDFQIIAIHNPNGLLLLYVALTLIRHHNIVWEGEAYIAQNVG